MTAPRRARARVDFVTDRGVARVLDRTSLSIAPGEVVGLVGESGCGKTTLARAVLGILPPAARIRGGEIRFKGRDLLEEKPRPRQRRGAGQGHHLHPAGSVHLVQPRLHRGRPDHGSHEVEVAAAQGSRRRRPGPPRGRPPRRWPACCAATRPPLPRRPAGRAGHAARGAACPSPSGRSGGCRTSSPAASASG